MTAEKQIRLLKLVEKGSKARLSISTIETALDLPLEAISRYSLVEGIVLTPSQLEILKAEAEQYECHLQAGRMLAGRSHSKGNLHTKLRRKGYDDQAIKQTIAKYERMGALDDAQFALKMAQDLVARRPCGRSYLISYLQRRQIDRSLAEQTAGVVLRGSDETTLALESLEVRWNSFSQLSLERARTRAYNYLARRGFGYAAAKAAFERKASQAEWEKED